MGTPEFAVDPLKEILESGFNVLAVVTAPDKPSGRGQNMSISPVKEFAIKQGLPVLQPTNLKNESFISTLREFGANIQVVIAFRMLPDIIWQMPELGTINIHASLLPQYRGAAPINHVLINGETTTGLTSFFIEKEIDTGKIIKFRKVVIDADDNAGSLHDKLKSEAGSLLKDTLTLIENGNVHSVSQSELVSDNGIILTAPKIFKNDCMIDWNQSCKTIHNFIRGLSPLPGSYTTMVDKNGVKRYMKIFKSDIILKTVNEIPGTIFSDNKTFLDVVATDGIVQLKEVQLEGKVRMRITDFLNGIKVTNETYFD